MYHTYLQRKLALRTLLLLTAEVVIITSFTICQGLGRPVHPRDVPPRYLDTTGLHGLDPWTNLRADAANRPRHNVRRSKSTKIPLLSGDPPRLHLVTGSFLTHINLSYEIDGQTRIHRR